MMPAELCCVAELCLFGVGFREVVCKVCIVCILCIPVAGIFIAAADYGLTLRETWHLIERFNVALFRHFVAS